MVSVKDSLGCIENFTVNISVIPISPNIDVTVNIIYFLVIKTKIFEKYINTGIICINIYCSSRVG